MSELPAENTDGVPPPTSDVPLPRSGWSYRAWLNTGARFLALLAVFAFFAILVEDGRFYTSRNLENILRQSAVYATAALGMTMVIVSGGIDLSVGSIIAPNRRRGCLGTQPGGNSGRTNQAKRSLDR